MEITAQLKNLRISTRKVRLAANLLRGLTVSQAEKQLKFLVKRSALPLEKLLKSAVANAENGAHLAKENLYISKVLVDQGRTMKRWRARARGQAAEILKRTSHIKLVLSEIAPNRQTKKKKIARTDIQRVDKNKEISLEKKEKEGRKEKTSKKTYVKPEDKKAPKQKNVGGLKKVFRRKSI